MTLTKRDEKTPPLHFFQAEEHSRRKQKIDFVLEAVGVPGHRASSREKIIQEGGRAAVRGGQGGGGDVRK